MNIERRSLMNNRLGLIGACMAAQAGISAVYVVDEHITVLRREDGSYSFKDHKTGKTPSKYMQKKIAKEIKEREI